MTEGERAVRTTTGSADPRARSPHAAGDGATDDPPPGVPMMALLRWVLVALMAVIAVLSVSYSLGLSSSVSASAASIQYYCPMHPQVVRDHPGECPICSMTLVEKQSEIQGATRYGSAGGNTAGDKPTGDKSAGDTAPESSPAPPPVPGLVPVQLSLDRVQSIGVRTAPATLEALGAELRAVGFVSADESRLARVHSRFSGWIERLEVATTGQKVARGQVLAGLYNLELLPAQQEYLAARRWGARSAAQPSGDAKSIERDARARLELFGLSRGEIDRIAESGNPTRTVAVTAPIGGYVIRKNAVQGAFVQPDNELFEIADLSRVWVLVNIYESEVGRVSVGQTAEVSINAYPGERFMGKVGFMSPIIEPSTRTLSVRVELDNRAMKLRPGMYAAVTLRLDVARATVVPAEALVDTGDHQYVFVARPGGRFEPRPVKTGQRAGEKVQILDGLSPGEEVVTTANFLIDSESRLRGVIEGSAESSGAPIARPWR